MVEFRRLFNYIEYQSLLLQIFPTYPPPKTQLEPNIRQCFFRYKKPTKNLSLPSYFWIGFVSMPTRLRSPYVFLRRRGGGNAALLLRSVRICAPQLRSRRLFVFLFARLSFVLLALSAVAGRTATELHTEIMTLLKRDFMGSLSTIIRPVMIMHQILRSRVY